MNFRYNSYQKLIKGIYRKFFPIPKSSYTVGPIQDICAVELVPQADLKKFFISCLQMLNGIKGSEVGDYLEFGVFNGSSIASMYMASKEMKSSIRLFGFDAFEGLPADSENEDNGVWKKGFYQCFFEKTQECLMKKNVDLSSIIWVKGWYNETLNNQTLINHNLENPGIIFIDCDTYSSSKTVLDFLAPIIKKPVIICLDDWKLNDLDIIGEGEYRSFNEFLEENSNLYAKEIPSYNRKSKSFLINLK